MDHDSNRAWRIRTGELDWGRRSLVMGILNVTPDSFSDGGRYSDADSAVRRALEMVEEGADIIDVGGESSRPGSDPVPGEEEIRRVVPVIERIRAETEVPVSVDTMKSETARRAVAAGASIINDISAGEADPAMFDVAAGTGAGLILMHMRGRPKTMQRDPRYADVVGEIREYLDRRVERALDAGIPRESLAIDPGIGFGKTVEHNLVLLRELPRFVATGFPVVVGASRKSFIGAVLDRPVEDRVWGTATTVAIAVWLGAAVVRVHDVRQMRDVVRMTEAIRAGRGG